MNRRFLITSASVLVAAALTTSFASRSALSIVAHACQANDTLRGSPFPCIKVVQASEPLTSYAVLREPTFEGRTVLTPLADLNGVEDPRLLTPGGPNYFDLAWNERAVVMNRFPAKDPWQDAALAINAAVNRTQDHLHIHMACVSTRVKASLFANSQNISQGEFKKFNVRIDGRYYWARLIAADSLSDENPFQLVAAGVPGARADMSNVTIGVIGTKLADGRKGFYIMAEAMNSHSGFWGEAEDLLDPQCRG